MAVSGMKSPDFSGVIYVRSATIDINIKTESDEFPCRIISCAVVSSDKLALADCNNNKLKVLDTRSNLIVMEKQLDSTPWDVTVLPHKQIAVNVPDERVILIMSTDNELSTLHTIPVNSECRSLTFHQDYLYAIFKNPNTVVILDTKGTVHNTISLDTSKFENPYCIVVSKDSKHMYISYPKSKCVIRVTLQGEISAVYNDCLEPTGSEISAVYNDHLELTGSEISAAYNDHLEPTGSEISAVYNDRLEPTGSEISAIYCNAKLEPTGMTILDDGSLLVCGSTGTIYHISADLKQDQVIKHGLPEQWSICYNHHQRKVYIGGFEHDRLKVFILENV